jgi:hypothetical protein
MQTHSAFVDVQERGTLKSDMVLRGVKPEGGPLFGFTPEKEPLPPRKADKFYTDELSFTHMGMVHRGYDKEPIPREELYVKRSDPLHYPNFLMTKESDYYTWQKPATPFPIKEPPGIPDRSDSPLFMPDKMVKITTNEARRLNFDLSTQPFPKFLRSRSAPSRPPTKLAWASSPPASRAGTRGASVPVRAEPSPAAKLGGSPGGHPGGRMSATIPSGFQFSRTAPNPLDLPTSEVNSKRYDRMVGRVQGR